MAQRDVNLIAQLEDEGESSVRARFERGEFGLLSIKSSWVKVWLDSKELARRIDREEETLSIARRANDISEEANSLARKALSNSEDAKSVARWANRIAIMAMIFSAIMAIIGLYK